MRPMKMFNTTFVLRFTISSSTNEGSFDDITMIGKKLYYFDLEVKSLRTKCRISLQN